MGSKGDSYDKKTREAVELATLEWVSWFNHHRLLEPLGYIPPAEAEANYYKQLSSQAIPA
ncbi:integrase core domain-containing protein [Massilia kyonggiensis]